MDKERIGKLDGMARGEIADKIKRPFVKHNKSAKRSAVSTSESGLIVVPTLPADTPHYGSSLSFDAHFVLRHVDYLLTQKNHSPARTHDRLHLSTIIRHAAVRLKILKDKDLAEMDDADFLQPSEITDTVAVHRICLGLAIEDLFGLVVFRDVWAYHFGEVEADGIVGSPDAVWTATLDRDREGNPLPPIQVEILVEVKLTWKSVRNRDDWMWLAQVKGYCKMLGIRQVRIMAFHVNGNYAPPAPILRIHDFFFTEREIEENWQMLVRHARKHLGLK